MTSSSSFFLLLGRFATAVALVAGAGTISGPAAADRAAVLPAPAPGGTPPAAGGGEPVYDFLSSPDFLNMDLGDVSGLSTWDGVHNSTNASYQEDMPKVLDRFEDETPEDVLVAGDLVMGRWGKDRLGTGNFGPLGTRAERRAAVRRAATLYLRAWRQRFSRRGLDFHAALGDHDIGDNPWQGPAGSWPEFKRKNLDRWKTSFYRHIVEPQGYRRSPDGPAAGTAYAVRLHSEVLLVTVDVFKRTKSDVLVKLDTEQLDWLDRVLTRANDDGIDWVIVQGHTPVLGPVRVAGSSGLMYQGGKRSAFWKTLAKHDVDLYLCGEVHAVTARRLRGVTQISHGGVYPGPVNFMTGRLFADRLELATHAFEVTSDRSATLWQTATTRFPPVGVVHGDTSVTGTMVLRPDNQVVSRTGLLAPYNP